MTDLNTYAKSIIEIMTCPVHQQTPIFEIQERSVHLECCCTLFEIECLKKCVDVFEEYKARLVLGQSTLDQPLGTNETKGLIKDKITEKYNFPHFFSVYHIVKPSPTKLIYGVKFKNIGYYFFKSIEVNDCEQLDPNPPLEVEVFENICKVITEIEKHYKRAPVIKDINLDIFNILIKAENPGYNDLE